MARKAAELTQSKVRIMENLLRDLERVAKKNHRSANAEAVERLSKSFETGAVQQRDYLIEMLLGGDKSADFLQWLAIELRQNLNNPDFRKPMIEEVKRQLDERFPQ